MKTHNHSIEPGTEIDVIITTEKGDDITAIGTIRAVHARDLILGFALIDVEYTDPRTDTICRCLALSDSRRAEDYSGMEKLTELLETRAKELRQLTERAPW